MTGVLLAPSDPADYKWVKNESFLLFRECYNFTLHGWGAGSIDGRGQRWWDLARKHSIERPKLVILDDSRDVSVRDIHLKDSPMFHLVPDDSENVLIEGVTISAPGDSPNTDGIDPGGSKSVVIRNCVIGTGDDNVAVKPGCEDVVVEDCLFQSGHGCSIGSVNTTGVRDVVLRNITFVGTENGARIKTWQGGSGLVENISYINLRMDGVGLPIRINMYYCPGGGCHNHSRGIYMCESDGGQKISSPTPGTKYSSRGASLYDHEVCLPDAGVTIKDILLSNISGTQTSGLAGELYCSDTVPCTHITMENIDIRSHDQDIRSHDQYIRSYDQSRWHSGRNEFKCWRAFGSASHVEPPSCLMPDEPYIPVTETAANTNTEGT